MGLDFWLGAAGSTAGVFIGMYITNKYESEIKQAMISAASQALRESMEKEYLMENPHVAFRRRMNPLGLYL